MTRDILAAPMLYRPRDAARELGVSRETVYRLIRSGRLAARMPRGSVRGMRVSADDLRAYVDSMPEVK